MEYLFEGIDIGLFLSIASKLANVNSFNAGRALERIREAKPEKMYETLAPSAIKQAGTPTERLHADTTTISFYDDYDVKGLKLKEMQEKGFQYGVFVADSKLVTHDLVTSMNDPKGRIPFVSRCPSNFKAKLEKRCILRAYQEDTWKNMGQFHEGKKAAFYRGQCFQEKVCDTPGQ